MARLIGPDEASREVKAIVGKIFQAKSGRQAQLWADDAATIPADVLTVDGAPIPQQQPAGNGGRGLAPTVTIDSSSMLPLIQYPDGVDWVVVTCDGGPPWRAYARTDDRLDTLGTRVGAVEGVADGLGGAATLDVGTTAGTVAAGDDSRIPDPTIVRWAPAPSGDTSGVTDTAAIQTLLDACEAAGGGTVQLRAAPRTAPYWVQDLQVGTRCGLVGAGPAATWLKAPATGSAHVVKTKNFEALVAANTASYLAGVPVNPRIENLAVDGNKAGRTAGHGIAMWALRALVRNVFVYNAKQDGIYSNLATGTTGGYPDGQIEPVIENIWIRFSGGTGLNYLGPNDGRIDNVWIAEPAGDGFVTGLTTDVGFVHVYGAGGTGVILGGVTRAEYIESENNQGASLVHTAPNTSFISKFVAFNNWKGSPGDPTKYAVTMGGNLIIGEAMINCEQGDSGVLVTNDRCGIGRAIINGYTGTGVGVDVQASKFLCPALDVYGFNGVGGVGLRTGQVAARDDNQISGAVSDCTTGVSIPNLGGGNGLDLSVYTSVGTQTPWSLPATIASSNRIWLRPRGAASASAVQYGGQTLILGGDANLYRSAANKLKTDGALEVAGQFSPTGGMVYSGAGAFFATTMTAAGNIVGAGRVAGDANNRWDVRASGEMNWGPGTGAADVKLYRRSVDQLRTDDKFLASLGIGVGNSAVATTPGAVVRRIEVFDETGASLGFIPVYNAIT